MRAIKTLLLDYLRLGSGVIHGWRVVTGGSGFVSARNVVRPATVGGPHLLVIPAFSGWVRVRARVGGPASAASRGAWAGTSSSRRGASWLPGAGRPGRSWRRSGRP